MFLHEPMTAPDSGLRAFSHAQASPFRRAGAKSAEARQAKLLQVLIAGDDRAKFGATVTILDEVRKAGIDQVSVETQVRPTGK